LALADVIAGGFARGLRVAGDAEHIVAQLEGLTEGESELGDLIEQILARPGHGRTEQQRLLDRVLRGLEAEHLPRPLGAARVVEGAPPRAPLEVPAAPPLPAG